MIYHAKHDVHNSEEYILLAKGHYVGCSRYGSSSNKIDNIELQMLVTKLDREMSDETHKVTKIRDTTLVSCANLKQTNMFEREVIATFIFVWADCMRMT